MPEEIHHIATNKNDYYTPDFIEIVSKYGLDLDGDWNKILIKHRGTHPWEYHDYILSQMESIDLIAKGDTTIFVTMWKELGELLKCNPQMLYTEFWRK